MPDNRLTAVGLRIVEKLGEVGVVLLIVALVLWFSHKDRAADRIATFDLFGKMLVQQDKLIDAAHRVAERNAELFKILAKEVADTRKSVEAVRDAQDSIRSTLRAAFVSGETKDNAPDVSPNGRAKKRR